MWNKIMGSFCGGFIVVLLAVLLAAMGGQEIFADQAHVASKDSVFVICTPPKREVCGPVHPGPGPIICRCV